MDAGFLEKQFLSVDPIRLEIAPASFIAGWYYNLTLDNKVKYIEQCYTPNEDLTNALYDSMEAYMKGDTQTGDEKMAAAKDLYPAALANCPEVHRNIDE